MSRRFWILVACCAAILFPGALVFGFPGVAAPEWGRMFAADRAELGRILFFVLAGVGVCMFITGRLQARFGPGPTAAAGALIYGGATFLVSGATSLTWIYAWAFAVGSSSAFVYLPTLTVAQKWYPDRKGLVSGLVSMFFGLSGAILAPVFALMIREAGPAWACRAAGTAFGAAGLVLALFIRGPDAAAAGPVKDGTLSLSLLRTLRTRSFWLLWFTFAFVGGAGISMVPMAIPFGTARGLAPAQAVGILMAFNVTNGGARLVSGWLSDFAGRKRVMSLGFLAAGAAWIALPHVSGFPAFALLAATVGYAFGTLFAVSAPFVSDCFGIARFGEVFGMVFTAFGFVSGVIGPWFSGWLLDAVNGDFTPVFTYLGCLMAAAALLIHLAARHAECRL